MDLDDTMFLGFPIESVCSEKVEHCQRLYHAGYSRKQACAFYQALKSTDYGHVNYFKLSSYLQAIREVYGPKSNSKLLYPKDIHIKKHERKIDNIYRMIHDLNTRLKELENIWSKVKL